MSHRTRMRFSTRLCCDGGGRWTGLRPRISFRFLSVCVHVCAHKRTYIIFTRTLGRPTWRRVSHARTHEINKVRNAAGGRAPNKWNAPSIHASQPPWLSFGYAATCTNDILHAANPAYPIIWAPCGGAFGCTTSESVSNYPTKNPILKKLMQACGDWLVQLTTTSSYWLWTMISNRNDFVRNSWAS